MDTTKESMDVASKYAQLNRDVETASTTTTVAPESTDGRWRLADYQDKFPLDGPRHDNRKRVLTYGLLGCLWVLSLAFTAWLASSMRLGPEYSYETGFDTDLGKFYV
jgi:hypothetical protein